MKKRLISFLLALTLLTALLPLSALAAALPIVYRDSAAYINPLYQDCLSEADLAKPRPYSTYADDTVYYDLNGAAAALRAGMKARQETVVVGYKTSQTYDSTMHKQISDAAMAHTGVPDEGDYLAWHYGGYHVGISYYSQSGYTYITFTYTLTYYTTAAQETALSARLASVLASLNLTGKSNYEKVQAVYDYICSHVTYDYTNLNNESYKLKFTAYAALINGTSVCQGYSLLLYRMLLELGIDCRVIVGQAGGAHAWNIAKLGSRYYLLDATWDSSRSPWQFFLKGNSTYFTLGDSSHTAHSPNAEYTTADFTARYPLSAADYTPGHSHTWDSGRVTRSPSCLEDGLRTFTCTACGETQTETIAATGHHFDDGVTTLVPTCIKEGIKSSTCMYCGTVSEEVLPTVPHIPVVDPTIAPTCTNAGLTEGSHCSVCKEVFVPQVVIPAAGHQYVSSFCSACGLPLLGDVLQDNAVNLKDVAALFRCLAQAGPLPAPAFGDINGDGAVTLRDVALLYRMILA